MRQPQTRRQTFGASFCFKTCTVSLAGLLRQIQQPCRRPNRPGSCCRGRRLRGFRTDPAILAGYGAGSTTVAPVALGSEGAPDAEVVVWTDVKPTPAWEASPGFKALTPRLWSATKIATVALWAREFALNATCRRTCSAQLSPDSSPRQFPQTAVVDDSSVSPPYRGHNRSRQQLWGRDQVVEASPHREVPGDANGQAALGPPQRADAAMKQARPKT